MHVSNAIHPGAVLHRPAVARIAGYGVAAGGVALITWLIALLQPQVEAGRLQMTYLLLVLALAIISGIGPAIVASLLAFLAFDWWFVKPVGNLLVSSPDEWLALGLFLLVGVSTGSLAAGLKQSAAVARRRTDEATMLYELSTALLAGPNLQPVLSDVAHRLVAALGLQAAVIHLAGADGAYAVSASGGTGTAMGRLVDAGPAPESDLEAHRLVNVPLTLNGRSLGTLTACLYADSPPFGADALRLLRAFAAQTALAVGRVRLIEEEERARAAEESDRMKSVFLASISHDLRTPLTTIKTAAALLLTNPDPTAGKEASHNINQEADRLDHFVGNLLEISRIEAASDPPQIVLEDLAELTGATATRMGPFLGGRRLRLRAAEDLPLTPLDAAQIARVLTNLLGNAIKFSPPDSVISLDLGAMGEAALLRIHNISPPIPPEEQRQIFDKFHRGDRDRGNVGGTGLGLSICKGIVEAHGGQIWTQNDASGVAFYVTLPAVTLPAATLPVRQKDAGIVGLEAVSS